MPSGPRLDAPSLFVRKLRSRGKRGIFGPALRPGSAVPHFVLDPRPASSTTSCCAGSSAVQRGEQAAARWQAVWKKLMQLASSPIPLRKGAHRGSRVQPSAGDPRYRQFDSP